VARLANLIYVYSDDADYSAYYAIDNNLAPVISESFGLCEYFRWHRIAWALQLSGGGAERQCAGDYMAGFVGRFGRGRLRL
jgi:hypothetical protein